MNKRVPQRHSHGTRCLSRVALAMAREERCVLTVRVWAAALAALLVLGLASVARSQSDSPPDANAKSQTSRAKDDAQPKAKAKPEPEAEVPYILRPYRVAIHLAFQSDPSFSQSVCEEAVKAIRASTRSGFRQMWNAKVVNGSPHVPLTRQGLLSLDELDATSHLAGLPEDKIFLVLLESHGPNVAIGVREWDASSRTLSSVHDTEIADRRTLAATVFSLVAETFRPLAILETISETEIELQIRAGELPPADPELAQFVTGDYLFPYLRYLDRSGDLTKLQVLPWTYLKVEDIDRSRLKLSLVSAFRNPIPLSRRRVEVLAMRVRPHLTSTEIKIYPRGNPENPLVGYRCEALDQMPTEDSPAENPLKLSTDRRGIVTLPVDAEFPVQYLYVYSGQAVLARVPVIPGAFRQMEIEVPDDRARLHVEGEVSLLQSELINLVATREVIIARTKAAAAKDQWQNVTSYLKDLDGITTQEQFLARIQTLQVQAVYQAQQEKDRVAESRIKRLCTEIRERAEKHLDPFRIAEFRRDMQSQMPQKAGGS